MISNSRRQIDIEAKIPLKDPAFASFRAMQKCIKMAFLTGHMDILLYLTFYSARLQDGFHDFLTRIEWLTLIPIHRREK